MAENINFNLTDIEKEIINYLKFGFTNMEIAKEIHVSVHTVKYHISSIIKKTNAINRINAIFILGKNGYFN